MEKSSLNIASINIERSKHLDTVKAFLENHQPDVLLLQELCRRDIEFFSELMQCPQPVYAPMLFHPAEDIMTEIGVAMFARQPLKNTVKHYYHGTEEIVPIRIVTHGDHVAADNDTISNVLLAATVGEFRIGTTHVNVTPHGLSTPEQRASIAKLITQAQAQAAQHGGLLLTGDFNAPRGRESFAMLAEAFNDGVPAHYTTSLDPEIHKTKGRVQFMVDGLFHTPTYKLEDAKLHTGVSDHMALTATLMHA